MTKVELIIKEPQLKFVVRGINTAFANAIRRFSQEIPVLAVDMVEFTKNGSALFDEFLAHRIGLVPLKTDKTFTLAGECTCKGKGCAKCSADLTLKAEGPCTVYAKDLKSKSVKVVYPDMPLVILEKGQELELIATAKLGKGKEHAKFSPCLIFYNQYPTINTKACDGCSACIDACPKKILDIKDKKIIVKDLLKCDICGACAEACKSKGKDAINVEGSNEDFIFTIESWGQLSEKEIFTEISESLDNELKKLSKEIEKIR